MGDAGVILVESNAVPADSSASKTNNGKNYNDALPFFFDTKPIS